MRRCSSVAAEDHESLSKTKAAVAGGASFFFTYPELPAREQHALHVGRPTGNVNC